MRFDELIAEYVIKTDKERVVKNTRDDFKLGPGWIFIGGFHREPEPIWCSVWARLKFDTTPQTGFWPHSLQFFRARNSDVRVTATDQYMIGKRTLDESITDIPSELQPMITDR